MEAFELHASETSSLPYLRASYHDLNKRFDMPSVAALPLTRDSLFNEEWPFHWHLGWDIVSQTEFPVPLATVAMSRANALVESMGAFHVTSNGLGAGNTFLEAVASGLYEVIERDAFACCHYAAVHKDCPIPVVPDDHLQAYPLVANTVGLCEKNGVRVVVQDCTVDTQVPTYNAIVYDRADRGVGIVHGTGAHLDSGVALLRAITEALQARLNFIAGSRDDIFRSAFKRWRGDWHRLSETLERERSESPSAPLVNRRAGTSFEADVHELVRNLSSVNIQVVIVTDLTPPDWPVVIVRVQVPGLEGYMHHGYRPGIRASSYLPARKGS